MNPAPASLAFGLYARRTAGEQAERALMGRHATALEALDALLLVHEYRVIRTNRWSWEGQPVPDLAYEVCPRRVGGAAAGAPLARIADDTLTVTPSFQMALPRRNLRVTVDQFLAHMHLINGTTPVHTPRLRLVVTTVGHLSTKGARHPWQ